MATVGVGLAAFGVLVIGLCIHVIPPLGLPRKSGHQFRRL